MKNKIIIVSIFPSLCSEIRECPDTLYSGCSFCVTVRLLAEWQGEAEGTGRLSVGREKGSKSAGVLGTTPE